MKALSLAGGDLVGVCFEAGVLAGMTEQGEAWDAITGTSAGAIVATYLGNQLGLGRSWHEAASDLVRLLYRLKGPKDVVQKRGKLRLGWSLVANRAWPGVYSLDPLRKLLAQNVSRATLLKGPPVRVAVFNLDLGVTQYVGPDDPDYLEFVVASASVPIITPVVVIRGNRYCDGGIQEIAPAVQLGATSVDIVTKSPEGIPGRWAEPETALQTLQRVIGGMTREILESDLKLATWINRASGPSNWEGYRFIPKRVIRARKTFPGIDMAHFSPQDVAIIVRHGREVT